LQQRLGIHVDLAPVAAWRLRWATPSIFWYETALRGQILCGDDLLDRIRTRTPEDLDGAEGLRLLVNRAAGLLLADDDAHAMRIQAAKALLAALDARMLAAGHFAPSQTERWSLFHRLLDRSPVPDGLLVKCPWLDWAYKFKVDPDAAPQSDPHAAWQAARTAILDAVPAAVRRAGLKSLSDYARGDGAVERVVYALRAHRVPGARRLVANPTGRVRVATLRMLEAARDGYVDAAQARRLLSGIARSGEDPMGTLRGLRAATFQ
jgi:hypothetical protein